MRNILTVCLSLFVAALPLAAQSAELVGVRDAAAAVHAGADEAVARASDGVPPDMDALVGLLLAGSLTGAQQAEQESEQPDKGASA